MYSEPQKVVGKMSKEKFKSWILIALQEFREFEFRCVNIGPDELLVTIYYWK